MKSRLSYWITAAAVALGLSFTATSLADIQDVQPQPTVYLNMTFGGAGDEPVQNTMGFRVDYDMSQVSRRLSDGVALPSMLKAEYGADGKVYLYSNGVPLNNHDYRLHQNGENSFGALDLVAVLGAVAAGYFIYDNVENDDDDDNTNNGAGPGPGTGPGSGPTTCATAPTTPGCPGTACTTDADCTLSNSGTCTPVANVCAP